MKRIAVATALSACVLVAACGGIPAASSAPSGVLTIANANGSPWECGFNPFNGQEGSQAFGPVYEPLAFVNALRNGHATPWLATAWHWGDGDRTLTFSIRKGVSFSDGTPMSAADVVYTFQLIRRVSDLDSNDVWSVLSSVTQSGPDQVLMRFKSPNVPYFYYIAGQVPILPRHVWSRLKNPVTYADDHPVGTGAFEVQSCTPRVITYSANRHYWAPGEPHIAKVVYPAFLSNDAPTTSLATGRAQWGSQFIPNIKAFYLSQSPSFRAWFPPVTTVGLAVNLTDPLLGNVSVRRAMAYAINRPQVAKLGEYSYEPPANQTGIVTPTFSGWLDKGLLAKDSYSYDPAKARQVLAAAGFHRGPGGVAVNSAGRSLSFTVINVAGYSDWQASLQVIAADFAAVGIRLRIKDLSSNAQDSAVSLGRYQLAYYGQAGGPSPYYEIQQWLYSPFSSPVGQNGGSDIERYRDPATDSLLNAYARATSPAVQHRITDQLERVMLSDVPFIPVTEQVDWFEYDVAAFSGWPTQADPYAQPSAYVSPDWGQVLLHLTPK